MTIYLKLVGIHQGRVHMEDFAQALNIKPQQKYEQYTKLGANLLIILNTIQRFSPFPIRDQQQVIMRVLVNLLLGNGDAHLKNWGLIYYDKRLPELAPAYDIVFTEFYMGENDGSLAMKIGDEKNMHVVTEQHFMLLAELAD